MLRRDFLSKLSFIGTALGLASSSKASDTINKENIYEFTVENKIEPETARSKNEILIVKKINIEYRKNQRLLSIARTRSGKANGAEFVLKHVYTFNSLESKLQYISEKTIALNKFRESLRKT